MTWFFRTEIGERPLIGASRTHNELKAMHECCTDRLVEFSAEPDQGLQQDVLGIVLSVFPAAVSSLAPISRKSLPTVELTEHALADSVHRL